MDFPIQDDTDVEQGIFADLQVLGERMLVPSEEHAGGNRLDIHGGRFDYSAVVERVFDDFLVEHLVFAPAGDGKELVKAIRVGGNVEIALNVLPRIAILRAGLKVFADYELQQLNFIVRHGVILINPPHDFKGRTIREAGPITTASSWRGCFGGTSTKYGGATAVKP